jgi:rhodanese-related sulfurtransferase
MNYRVWHALLVALALTPLTNATPPVASQSVRQYKNLTESLGCKKLKGVKSDLDFDLVSAVRIIYGSQKTPFYMLPARDFCIKQHETHRFLLWENRQILGEADITLIGVTTLATLNSDIEYVTNTYPGVRQWVSSVKTHFRMYFPDVKESDPIIGFEFSPIRKSDNYINPYSHISPASHRFAKTVTYTEVARMVAEDKPFIVDTRQKRHFDWWHLPDAHSFPVDLAAMMAGTPFDYRQIYDLQVYINPSALPKDRSAKILLIGHSVLDWSTYYAATMLHVLGFKNLFWYRRGQEDWHQIRRVLPDDQPPDGVERVAAAQVLSELNSSKFIDVRTAGRYMQGHLPNSLSLPYETGRMPPRVDGDYGPDTFLSDKWAIAKLPPDRLIRLVIVGQDESDWSAVLATRRATSLGYQARWFKGGFAEWMALNKWYGNKYPVSVGQ